MVSAPAGSPCCSNSAIASVGVAASSVAPISVTVPASR